MTGIKGIVSAAVRASRCKRNGDYKGAEAAWGESSARSAQTTVEMKIDYMIFLERRRLFARRGE